MNDSNPEPSSSDADYATVVDWLSRTTVPELRSHRLNPEALRVALSRYFARGLKARLSTCELVDFLGVSTPSLLDTAGYSDSEITSAMRLAGSLSDEEIAHSGES